MTSRLQERITVDGLAEQQLSRDDGVHQLRVQRVEDGRIQAVGTQVAEVRRQVVGVAGGFCLLVGPFFFVARSALRDLGVSFDAADSLGRAVDRVVTLAGGA